MPLKYEAPVSAPELTFLGDEGGPNRLKLLEYGCDLSGHDPTVFGEAVEYRDNGTWFLRIDDATRKAIGF